MQNLPRRQHSRDRPGFAGLGRGGGLPATLTAMVLPTLALAVLLVPQEPAAERTEPTAKEIAADFTAWRDHLRPGAAELAWESIPWRSTFADGLLAASRAKRPLLFWAMNGHPLGCT